MLEDIIRERKKKLEYLRSQGIDPYPARVKKTTPIADVLKNFGRLSRSRTAVTIRGRVRGLRDQGKIMFLEVEDVSGRMQTVARSDALATFETFRKTLDIGDFVQVSGTAFLTKRGEKSVDAKTLVLLTKSLRPLPGDFYGLRDEELRLRKRYVDTLVNPHTRELFVQKARFWSSVREFLNAADFLEVDTPTLEATPGGAEAEPFVTHYNALDEDFYLRISLEISLKKMLVGGFEKIYEIGRIFRNEGISAEHLQDYTQCEFYWAYADYTMLMKFVEQMYKSAIKKTFGTATLTWEGKKIYWAKPWKTINYVDIFKEKNGIDPLKASRQELAKKALSLGLSVEPQMGKGRLIDLIFKKTVRPSLVQPCFLINPPTVLEPLAKRLPENPDTVQRLQVMACTTELGKGFSELNDPLDQRARFEEQAALRAAGDREAQRPDEDFLEALEYGMPPAAGFGFSERLFAVLADKPIREIIFFPSMKQKD